MRVTMEISAPVFPRDVTWFNVASLRMEQQRGRPVLVEFWDYCRINSRRTLPYLRAWHERYAEAGLRVIGVHTGGFACSREPENIEAAVTRLGIDYPVLVDSGLQVWDMYGNQGWPARYLWAPDLSLYSVHYGEGAYVETELEIGELLGIQVDPVPPVRAADAEGVLLPPQTDDRLGRYEGPYEAGGVHLVCTGSGELVVNGSAVAVDGCDCYTVLEHETHTTGTLEVAVPDGVEVLATCFTPAPARA